MVKDPRPSSSGPEDPLDLLRALARTRAPAPPHDAARADPPPAHPPHEDEKLDALRALAASLDLQLRSPHQDAAAPGTPHAPGAPAEPPPQHPASPPAPQAAAAPASEWRAFRDGLPSARALLPRLRAPEILYVAIAVAVLIAAAIVPVIQRHVGPAPPADVVPPVSVPTAPAPSTDEPPPPDLAAVKKAMSECDAAAAQAPDSLYFLILPLVRPDPRDTNWNPLALQTVGNAYALLGANDALDGLRDGKVKVRPGRYTFSVLDTMSGATYSWTSATGMIRLARKDSGSVKTLKLGFDFSSTQAGAQWSAEFKRDLGTCYWVSVLVGP